MTVLAILALGWTLLVPQASSVSGTVRDTTGAVVPGATVVVRQPPASDVTTATDDQGAFAVPRQGTNVVITISAPGFVTVTRTLMPADQGALEITLAPALAATVTVTAGRIEQRLGEIASTVSVVDRALLDRSPAMTTDDVLRQVPAFSLFRRASSVAAHPTAQGVSLRGIGPSGVSRTLVLLDGVPFNDPFGGWISWTRVPRAAVERIEVVEGSAANLFGNYSMGGAINILTRDRAGSWVDATLQYGERETPLLDAGAALRRGRWTGIIDGGLFRTDGYPVVFEGERGAVDENVSASSQRAYASSQYELAAGTWLHGKADFFNESRQNGKRSTIDGTPEQNETEWLSAKGGVRTILPGGSELRTDVFGDRVRFRSNFLAVPAATPPRSIGRMTLNQFVPSSSVGVASQWTGTAGRWSVLTGGVDWRRVEGESREDGLDPQTGTRVTLHRRAGGTQNNLGLFAQGVVTPASPLVLTLGLRHDRWTNKDGHNIETDVSGNPTPNHRPELPESTDQVTTPRVSALLKLAESASVWTSVGWGFRAPTLNELYRQFRVGLVTTLANEGLGPEHLRTIDAGVRITPHHSLLIRTAWFDNALRDAVSNVTLTSAPSGTIQQRQNLGLTRVRGAQLDLDWRPSPRAQLTGAYIFNVATVREFAANQALVGKYLPQVPRHRASVQLSVAHPRLAELAITLQAVGRQFDDDLNVRTVPGESEPGLPSFATLDILASRTIRDGLSLFAGAQNLFDQEVFVGTLPTTVGAPRLVSVGLRWRPSIGGR
jgi:outer membrane receptor protein involved in Fe transport